MPDNKMNLIETKLDYWIVESVKDQDFEEAFQIENELSSGPFGTILRCRPVGQEKSYCVKVLLKNKDRRIIQRETSLLLKLNHPNVDRFREIFETTDKIYIVSDLLIGGEILDRVCRNKKFTERDATKLLKQILEGIKYIHEEDMVHGNLKPENFLFENDNVDSIVKITDVALFTILDKDLLKHSIESSSQYCAPEVLRGEVGHTASDMWSLGAFTYTLLCGEEPFKGETNEEIYKNILKGEYETNSENYKRISINAKDFIMKLLTLDPQKRLTVHQALHNNWLLGKAAKLDYIPMESMKLLVNQKKTQAFLNKAVLKTKFSKPSLCQKYLPQDVWLWLQKKTKYSTTLVDCVKSALENPDSSVGLYAPDPDCYDTFPEIFWPVISEYHKVDVANLQAVHDFGEPNSMPEFESKYSDAIVSTRIRVGRTIEGFPMGPKLTREKREELKNLIFESFKNLTDDFIGDYHDLVEMSSEDKNNLIKSHYLFADSDDRFLKSAGGYNDWPYNRGIYLNRSKTFVVWINEEDHIRIISIQKGSNLKQVYSRLVKGTKKLEKTLKFVYHEKFGYLTFCPTNIGTGLRASVHVKLPKLAASGKLNQMCESLNLQPRGIDGEHSESQDGIYDISNKIRIGKTEYELVYSMWTGIKTLLDAEFKLK